MNNQMELSFLSLAENEAFARMVISAFLMQLSPTMSLVSEVRTAVSEAVTNCIVHAYRQESGSITMAAVLYDNGDIRIQIKDKGCGISDVKKAREPLFTTGDQERSGMGFTIMENFMDRIRVCSREGIGTQVTLTKHIRRRNTDGDSE